MKKRATIMLLLCGCLSATFAGEITNRPGLKAPHSSPAARSQNERNASVVIGHIEKRDLVITIKTSAAGRLYTVTQQGKVLHENLSETQLKAQAPEIHRIIETGVANDARARTVDARIAPR